MPARLELRGQTFGRLRVIQFSHRTNGLRYWLCVCECGTESCVTTGNLRSGAVASCGCSKGPEPRHGHDRRGERSPEYTAWVSMRERCKLDSRSKNYGPRGIRVCDRWQQFENFLEDMGQRPSAAHSLDRIDVNGNYEPSNCRWATLHEQSRNKRSTVNITIGGTTRCLTDWALLNGVIPQVAAKRIRRGWDPIRAVTEGGRRVRA